MAPEILISKPTLNYDAGRNLLAGRPDLHKVLGRALSEVGITPETHPIVLDAPAGIGGLTEGVLFPRGWKNITNIDIALPREEENLSPFPWIAMDLVALTEAISRRTPLPDSIEALRGKFDLMFALHLSPIDCRSSRLLFEIWWSFKCNPPAGISSQVES